MRLIIIGSISTVSFLLAMLHPDSPTSLINSVSTPNRPSAGRCLAYDSAALQIPGAQLTERQIGRGLQKRIERETARDQSLEGLRDIIAQSNDEEIKLHLETVAALEASLRDQSNNDDPAYRKGLIEDFAPLAVFIQEQTGLPASVTLAQLAVESGWASSNVTILKNNVMGLGNCHAPEAFTATVEFGDFSQEIPVTCMLDTTAFKFENVADSIFYYAYVVLRSEDNEPQYGPLRQFIRENRGNLKSSPAAYRQRVMALLAEGYHAEPEWYRDYISPLAEEFGHFDLVRLCD